MLPSLHRQWICLLIDLRILSSSSTLQPKSSNTHRSFSLTLRLSSLAVTFLASHLFFAAAPLLPHLALIHFCFFYSLVILRLHSLFHLSSLCLASLHALTVSSSVSQLSLFPLPYIPLSLPPSLSIDPAIVFCLPCAGWLALINIDNCLLSLHAKHTVFFLNESRSLPYATRLPLPPSPLRGNPSVNDRR